MANNSNNKTSAAQQAPLVGPPALAGGSSTPSLGPTSGGTSAGSGGVSSGGTGPGVIPGTGTKAKTGLRVEVTQVVTGIGTQLPDGSTLAVKGVAVSKGQLIADFAADLALFAAVDTDVQATKNDRLALKAATPGIREQLRDVKAALVATFGKGNPALVAFGFSGKKPKVLTTKQNLAKQVKADGTRKLRGTLGSVQKQDVKFQGQVEIQTNVSGSPAPTAGATPSSAGVTAGASNTPAAGASPSGPGSSTPSA
ncbi:MAG: hypothetical protein ACYDCL_12300 [Myxococcales bacterium]